MRQSQLFGKTSKETPKDEASLNSKLLIKAGFIDKLAAGIYSYLPLGLRVLNNIENIIREEMEAAGGQEIFLPALHPKKNWQKTSRWDTVDILFKLKGTSDKEFALGPTHEEVITPLAKRFVFSHKDLPLYLYQIQTKFRNEPRAKSGLLRGREFRMKDLYSFHAGQKDLDRYYEKVKKAYFKIYKRMGLADFTYLTFASGGIFSRYSHEFQTLAESGEDTIYLCEKCKIAVNKEIIEEQKTCPECGSENLQEKTSIEMGNIFKLADKFSKDFGFKYLNEKGSQKEVMMGCYGIGSSRVMGALVEIFNDEKGIVWPEEIAPFKVHLINLDDKSKKEAEEIYEDLQKEKIEVLYDDRPDIRVGEKFADSDLIGIPVRLVISKKTLEKKSIEYKKRSEDKMTLIRSKELLKKLK